MTEPVLLSLKVVNHPGVVVAGHDLSKDPVMTIGGPNHKLERCVRGALQDNGRFQSSVDLQNDWCSCRSNAWNQKATAIRIPVTVLHQPVIQSDRFIFPGDSIPYGKKRML